MYVKMFNNGNKSFQKKEKERSNKTRAIRIQNNRRKHIQREIEQQNFNNSKI